MNHFFQEQVLPMLHKLLPYGELGPRVEVRQTPNHVVVLAEVPGLRHPEHLDVRVQSTMITIRGEVTRELPEKEGDDLFYSERMYGKFSRSVPLPVAVVPDRVEASYQDGMLRVKMPKDSLQPGTHVPVDFS
ncbi:HSP20 family protein [Tumebacillus sp. BK434]|uniref:Hsp20/alpha crystallin family protein n=1 Tax=Tumebacillus sp. BK434 TaxID=2512169 RepID=UPI00104C852F|nr:Hsp20/alpha crystallin family protein [Tumebacillus sp. BK434]TCP54728.1 HSP20 family protein [Tumebacillus sp. BK434]